MERFFGHDGLGFPFRYNSSSRPALKLLAFYGRKSAGNLWPVRRQQIALDIKVLCEDNHLIAVYKPAGVLIQAENNTHNDDTLYWQLKMFLKERDQKPGNVFLGVLHRLDRVVSGIVLFAKTSK